jgi:hypothetical protein
MAVLCFGSGLAVQFEVLNGHRSPQPKANLFVYKETSSGKELIGSGNVITDIAEAYTEWWMTGCGSANATARSAPMWISLGNATVGQTLTKLTTEATTSGFERAAASASAQFTYNGDYARNFTKTFTASATITINAAGSHWVVTGDSDNNMYACGSLGGSQAFNAADNCTIVWMYVWDCN